MKRAMWIILALLMLAGVRTAGAPTLSADTEFYKKQGAHYEGVIDIWDVGGTLIDGSRKLYFSAVFIRGGSVFLQYRNVYLSLYDPQSGRYVYRDLAPVILARAAAGELAKKAKEFPNEKKYAEAAERLMNKQYPPEFVPLIEEATVFKEKLYMKYGPNLFERTSDNAFEYSLKLSIDDRDFDLKLNSDTDPFDYSGKNNIPTGNDKVLVGYAFPRLAVNGEMRDTAGTRPVKGVVWFSHYWGDPNWTAMLNYSFISLRLSNGESAQIFAFFGNGSSAKAFGRILSKDGKMRPMPNPIVEKASGWKSPASELKYPVKWRIRSGYISGTLEALHSDSEMSIADGRGAFWHGPCRFTGAIKGRKTTGDGVCRSVAPEVK